MPAADHRQRDRAARRELIVAAARALVEQQGWDAVTTRALAAAVDYSQPVLYGHFPGGKAEIISAVAVAGFGELTDVLRARGSRSRSAATALRAAAETYLAFARSHPALYDAMFARSLDVTFGRTAETPVELQLAFAELVASVADLPATSGGDVAIEAELLWSTLHGMATLSAAGRLHSRDRRARVAALVARYGAGRAVVG